MKLSKSFEQGVCIMGIIATQDANLPVSSRTLQKRLQCSMTYSQKILRKLVVAGLIKSVSGNNGGFSLAKPIDKISLLDIVVALEGKVQSYPSTGLFGDVFGNDSAKASGDAVNSADHSLQRWFDLADNAWAQVLATATIRDIIKRAMTSGQPVPTVDWNDDQVDINDILAIERKEAK